MPTPNPFRTLHPLNTDLNPVSSGPVECHVQNITAKFFMNRDLEELIPARYLRLANQTRELNSLVLLSLNKEGTHTKRQAKSY